MRRPIMFGWARNSRISAIFGIEIAVVYSSDLSAGTAGTGRVHPRRAADRAGTGRRVFFSKPYPTRLIPVPVVGTRVPQVWVRGYSSTRVGGSNVIMVY
jgi:hypothetical protein